MTIGPLSVEHAAMPSISGRVAIVTGAAQGIGRVFA